MWHPYMNPGSWGAGDEGRIDSDITKLPPFYYGYSDTVPLYHLIPFPHVERLFVPAVDVVSYKVPRFPGETYIGTELRPLQIVVTGDLASGTQEETTRLWEQFGPILMPRQQWAGVWEQKHLVTPDRPGIAYNATLLTMELERQYGHPRARLTFEAPDPIGYGEERTVNLAAGTTQFAVGGTYRTIPEEVFAYGAGGSFRITNVGTGLFTQPHGGAGGGNVDILPGLMRTLVGGVEASITIDSDYWYLEPGTASVTCTHACTLRYFERWY